MYYSFRHSTEAFQIHSAWAFAIQSAIHAGVQIWNYDSKRRIWIFWSAKNSTHVHYQKDDSSRCMESQNLCYNSCKSLKSLLWDENRLKAHPQIFMSLSSLVNDGKGPRIWASTNLKSHCVPHLAPWRWDLWEWPLELKMDSSCSETSVNEKST